MHLLTLWIQSEDLPSRFFNQPPVNALDLHRCLEFWIWGWRVHRIWIWDLAHRRLCPEWIWTVVLMQNQLYFIKNVLLCCNLETSLAHYKCCLLQYLHYVSTKYAYCLLYKYLRLSNLCANNVSSWISSDIGCCSWFHNDFLVIFIWFCIISVMHKGLRDCVCWSSTISLNISFVAGWSFIVTTTCGYLNNRFEMCKSNRK